MRKPEKLEELLNAAHHVVLRDGVARLTLDLVAKEAGVSKGAVLYYFPTKSALIGEMLKTHLDCHRTEWMREVEKQPQGPGRLTRGWLESIRRHTEMEGRGGAGMLAAVANDPELLSLLREKIGQWHRELEEDGLDPLRLQLIHYAMDGIKFSELMGIDPPTGQGRDRLIDFLLTLATPGTTL